MPKKVKRSYRFADLEIEQQYYDTDSPQRNYTFTIRHGDQFWRIDTWMVMWFQDYPAYEDRRAARRLIEDLYEAYSRPRVYDEDTERQAEVMNRGDKEGFLEFRKDLKGIAKDIGSRLKPAVDVAMKETARVHRSMQHRGEKGPREWFPNPDEIPP